MLIENAIQDVIDAITFDDSGIGGQGGNGGLISRETIRKVDFLRVLLLRRQMRASAPDVWNAGIDRAIHVWRHNSLPGTGVSEAIVAFLDQVEELGWRLVPIEPTQAMIGAASSTDDARGCYREMVSVAPRLFGERPFEEV